MYCVLCTVYGSELYLNVYWREGLNCREEYLRSKDPLAGSRTDSEKKIEIKT